MRTILGSMLVAAIAAAPAYADTLTSDDVAAGGKYLPAPLPLSGRKFQPVISIDNVMFTKGVSPRLLALGTLSLSGKKGGGPHVVSLRVVIDGKAEPLVLSTRVADGDLTIAPITIQCDEFPADGLAHSVTLEASVTGAIGGAVSIEAGNFDLVAFRPIFNPP